MLLNSGPRNHPSPLMPDKSPLPRWIAIAGFFGIAGFFINKALRTENPDQYLFGMAGAILCIVIGLFLLVPDVFGLVGRLVNSFFFPGGKSRKPVLSYKLPDFYRRNKRYREALEQYQNIVRHYPKEARAWIGVIEVQIVDLDDPEAAQQTYQRALHKLRSDRIALEDLRHHWAQIIAAPSANRSDHAIYHAE